ncbi:ATP-dependent DNA helicase Q5 [Echinococcus granulosus]|nr:ATP-dependent DNA helicase Q5 [Echinococcus granulosus]
MDNTDRVLGALRNTFHHDQFKSKLQEDAIRCIVEGSHNAFISMPTGSGKSLCYQLPAVLQDGLSIIISPLIALIYDQLSHLSELKIPAATLNSKQSAKERADIMERLLCPSECLGRLTLPKIKLLYITPEQCETDGFRSLANKLIELHSVKYFFVDEAHCVSEWGHDFRPAYLKLGNLRSTLFPTVPCIALTATANSRVKADIISTLKLNPEASQEESCLLITKFREFVTGVFRSNLYYDVMFSDLIKTPYDDLSLFIRQCLFGEDPVKSPVKNSSGIVYCRTREDCETVAYQLSLRGIPSRAYHAGLGSKDRTRVQEEWFKGDFLVVVATISFGMGVDNAHVRCVVHWTVPKSLAAYYQESGRAGRDGLPSHCRIYYAKQERDTVAFLVGQMSERALTQKKKEHREKGVQDLALMINYVESVKCRHAQFAAYFGDDIPSCVNRCDVCTNPTKVSHLLAGYRRVIYGSLVKGVAVDENEELDTDLYRIGPRRKGKGWEVYDVDEGRFVAKEGRDFEEEARNQRTKFVLEELSRRRKAGEAAGLGVPWISAAEDSLLIDPESKLINGLTGKTRDQTLQLLITAVCGHLTSTSDTGSDVDPEKSHLSKLAAQLEHQIFKTSKVAGVYRGHMARRISQARKAASLSAVYDAFAEWLNVPVTSLHPVNSNTPSSFSETLTLKPEEVDVRPSPPPPLLSSPPAPLLLPIEAKSASPHPGSFLPKPQSLSIGVNTQDILESTCLPPSLKKSLIGDSSDKPNEENLPTILRSSGESTMTYFWEKSKPTPSAQKRPQMEDPDDDVSVVKVIKKEGPSKTYFLLQDPAPLPSQSSQPPPLSASSQNVPPPLGLMTKTGTPVVEPVPPAFTDFSPYDYRGSCIAESSNHVFSCNRRHESRTTSHRLEGREYSEETRMKTSFIANVVVRSLSRYYSLGAFKDKATFKDVARELTRRLVKSGISDDEVQREISRITNRLVAPHRRLSGDSRTRRPVPISRLDDLAWTEALSDIRTNRVQSI